MLKMLLDKLILPIMVVFIVAVVTYAISFSVADASINGKLDKTETRLDGRITEVDIKHDGKAAVLEERCNNLSVVIANYHKQELELKEKILNKLEQLGRK